MRLFLQFGWGMMELSRELIQAGVSDTVILSPRDLEPIQLDTISRDIHEIGGTVLLDPQFYLPRADHHRLVSHDYWPDDYDTTGFTDGGRERMMHELLTLNAALGTSALIIPGERAASVNEDWLSSQSDALSVARRLSDRPIIATICLSAEAVRSNDQIALLIDYLEDNPCPTYYLVCEHPGNAYLVDDPQWLANILDMVAALKLAGGNVIAGYSNHQQLILACAGADAIASGTWLNIRCFLPDKFRSDYEEEVKRRATWYYLPQALSEYTLPYLDIAVRMGLTGDIAPRPPSPYAGALFAVAQPSISGWAEPDAFRHYLYALAQQTAQATRTSFEETAAVHLTMLEQAELLLTRLVSSGIRGGPREFADAINANRAALAVLQADHGPRLRRSWNTFSRL